MHAYVCKHMRLYTQGRVSTPTTNTCTEGICEETSFFKHKYRFPWTAQRQEALLKYLLQIAMRKLSKYFCRSIKGKDMVRVNQNTDLNRCSFDLPGS